MEEQKSIGPALGIIIIIVIIVIGGVYFWINSGVDEDSVLKDAPEEFQDEVQALQTQSASDELADIEADLDSTSLEGLDSDLGGLDSELEGLTSDLENL